MQKHMLFYNDVDNDMFCDINLLPPPAHTVQAVKSPWCFHLIVALGTGVLASTRLTKRAHQSEHFKMVQSIIDNLRFIVCVMVELTYLLYNTVSIGNGSRVVLRLTWRLGRRQANLALSLNFLRNEQNQVLPSRPRNPISFPHHKSHHDHTTPWKVH